MVNTLTKDLISAGEKLLRKADKSNLDIDAALWLHIKDQEAWTLLISVKDIEKEGPKQAYKELQEILVKAKIKDVLQLSFISLAKPNAPLLGLIKTTVRTGPKPDISGITFTGNVINGQLIPDAYIYRLS